MVETLIKFAKKIEQWEFENPPDRIYFQDLTIGFKIEQWEFENLPDRIYFQD